MRFVAVLLILAGSVVSAATRYDASLGTLPQAQGWSYSGDTGSGGTNASPVVSSGALNEITTFGAQYWFVSDQSLDFSKHVELEARLYIISSNEVPDVGTGTREGYYFDLNDSINGMDYSIGLASTGFNINTITIPNNPLTNYPFTVTDTFHTYRFVVDNFIGSFYIDGQVVASNIAPVSSTPVGRVLFGAEAGASMSTTELQSFCYSTTSSACDLPGIQTYSCTGFQPPFSVALSLKQNTDRAIPLKSQLFTAAGTLVDSTTIGGPPPVVNVTYSAVSGGTAVDETSLLDPLGQSSNGNQFNFDSSTGVWWFNLASTPYKAVGTYRVTIQSGDQTKYAISAQCSGTFERQK